MVLSKLESGAGRYGNALSHQDVDVAKITAIGTVVCDHDGERDWRAACRGVVVPRKEANGDVLVTNGDALDRGAVVLRIKCPAIEAAQKDYLRGEASLDEPFVEEAKNELRRLGMT